jgi:uracil-DNA glycosylase
LLKLHALSVNVQIHSSWKSLLKEEFQKSYFENLVIKLRERKSQATVYPRGGRIFAAFNHTPPENVKVIIVGQDPYHGAGQANGFSFSVNKGVRQPPSLKNILKELESDLGIPIPDVFNGDLTPWANQGVLLLNAILTVEHGNPSSHKNLGWQLFTNRIMELLSESYENLVFILWGAFAQGKSHLIDPKKHLIIKSPHPSPFSAHKGFFGSKPISRTKAYLLKHDKPAINWAL